MELCKHSLSEEVEIVAPRVGVGHPLFDPAPELLDFVEPWGIGGKKNNSNTGFCCQSSLNLGVKMNRPVVHDQIDLPSLRIEGAYLPKAAGQPLCGHPREVPNMDTSLSSLQQAHHPHQGVSTMAIAEPGLATSQARPQPGLTGLAIEACLISKQDDHLIWVCGGLAEGLLQEPLFSSYWESGE
jgi:hypothetical protein